jgi:hypothetical protein
MVTAPDALPRTIPDADTDAIALLEELQVPPARESTRVMVAPLHTDDAPIIAGTTGTPFTAIALVTVVLPQVFDTL